MGHLGIAAARRPAPGARRPGRHGRGQAAATATDYKALVCVFLYGGNDYANTVVTYDDPSYNAYSTIRARGANQTAGGIAIAKADLTPTLLNSGLSPCRAAGSTPSTRP